MSNSGRISRLVFNISHRVNTVVNPETRIGGTLSKYLQPNWLAKGALSTLIFIVLLIVPHFVEQRLVQRHMARLFKPRHLANRDEKEIRLNIQWMRVYRMRRDLYNRTATIVLYTFFIVWICLLPMIFSISARRYLRDEICPQVYDLLAEQRTRGEYNK